MYRGLPGVKKIFFLNVLKRYYHLIKHFVHIKLSHELSRSSNFSERASKNNRVAVTNSNFRHSRRKVHTLRRVVQT